MSRSGRWRRIYWAAGLGVVLIVVASPRRLGLSRPVAGLAIAIGWASLYGLLEAILCGRTAARSFERRIAPFRDAPAADGRVGLATLRATRSEPIAATAPHRRFVQFEPLPSDGRKPPDGAFAGFPPLLGRVVVLNLFLGRDRRDWSPAEIRTAHRQLVRAAEWIEREAARWSAPVNVELADVYFQALDPRPAPDAVIDIDHPAAWDRSTLDAFHDPAVRFSAAARALGCADAVELALRVADRADADHRVWLLHHRSAGPSCAYPGDLSDLPGLTFAVCYAREHDHEDALIGEPYADPITLVHELLHIFGAMDKYEQPLSSFPRKAVSERDVMRLDLDSLPRLRVDPLTAAELGWARPGADPPKAAGDEKGRRAPNGRRRPS